MNTETIYKNTCAALQQYLYTVYSNDPKQADKVYRDVIAAPANYKGSLVVDPFAALLLECVKEDAKKAGRGSALAGMKHLLKIGADRGKDKQPELGGTWDQDGLQMACNGFYGVALSDPLQGLPVNLDNKPGLDAFPGILQATQNNMLDISAYIPARADLANYIKRLKAAYPKPYKSVGPCYFIGNVMVNAQYLLDMIDILQPSKVMANVQGNYRPLYFEGATGSGVLLPVRVDPDYNEHCKKVPGCNLPADSASIWSNYKEV